MRILTSLAAVAVVALSIGLLSQAASADSVFVPTTSVRMCNAQAMSFTDLTLAGIPSCTDALTTGAATDTTITVGLPGTNVNFATQVTFMPTGTTITAGGSIPAGTKLGSIRETATFGITNSTCSNAVMADFILLNVALPNNPGSPLSSTNLAYPQSQGTSDRFSKWKVGSPPGGGDPSGINPGVDVAHAAGTSVAFQNYPRYLLDAFGNLIPTAAYGALTLSEGEWTPVYLLQFSAGQLATLPGAYSLMNSSMGFPLVWVRGDPTTTVPSPSNITDFCTPVNTTTVLLGRDPSTVFTRATTPAAAGTAMYSQYLASLRDTDQDGFENLIDTCPLAPDVGSPKSGGGDADTDGIDDSCDTVFAPFPSDGDFDGYINRLDNCPQIANTSQADSETATAPDRGPTRDQIGDPCEVGSITITQNGHSVTITPSTTVANGRYMSVTNVMPKCFGGTDADGDGYCTAGGVANDTAATDGGVGAACLLPTNSCFVRHTLWSGATHPGLQMDTDGDTVAADVGLTSNWSDVIETYLGTDPTKPCAQSSAGNNEGPLDNWPLDMDDNRLVNGADYLKMGNPLSTANGGNHAVNTGGNGDGTATTPATVMVPGMGIQKQTRFDLNYDGFLSGADLGKFNSYMNDGLCDGVGGSLNNVPATLGGTFQQ